MIVEIQLNIRVDKNLLEEQRYEVAELLTNAATERQMDIYQGILNLLDVISDAPEKEGK